MVYMSSKSRLDLECSARLKLESASTAQCDVSTSTTTDSWSHQHAVFDQLSFAGVQNKSFPLWIRTVQLHLREGLSAETGRQTFVQCLGSAILSGPVSRLQGRMPSKAPPFGAVEAFSACARNRRRSRGPVRTAEDGGFPPSASHSHLGEVIEGFCPLTAHGC